MHREIVRRCVIFTGFIELALVAACNSGPNVVESISPIIVEQIASCGGGINVSEHKSLAAEIQRTVYGVDAILTVSEKSSLRAAFIDAFPSPTEDAEWLYSKYVDCISGQQSLQEDIDGIMERLDEIKLTLQHLDFSDEIIDRLMSHRLREIGALENRDFVLARKEKFNFMNGLFSEMLANGRSFDGYGPDVFASSAPYSEFGPLLFCRQEYSEGVCRRAFGAKDYYVLGQPEIRNSFYGMNLN